MVLIENRQKSVVYPFVDLKILYVPTEQRIKKKPKDYP